MPIDAYYTRQEVADAIVARLIAYGDLRAGDTAIDPCVGRGAFAIAIRAARENIHVITLDLDPDIESDVTCDFLQYTPSQKPQLIGTNPPFSLWQHFVEHAVEVIDPRGTIGYLLRLGVLGDSKKQHRKEFFEAYPPSTIDALRPRPSFTGRCDNSEYALFRWRPQDFATLRVSGPRVGFIDYVKPRRKKVVNV